MQNYIDFNKVNCKDCYRCLRKCPVKSIKFTNHVASIIEEECILCGNCYLECPQKAKEIRDDVSKIEALIKNGNNVYVSLAPSFIANYSYNFTSIKKALLKLGFKDVFETAVGASAVTKEYEKILEGGKQSVVISTCCPTVNMLIRKHYPEAVKFMANVESPMIAHAKMIKEMDNDAYVVFIGPCLSKKEEVDEHKGLIEIAITYEELDRWMERKNIKFEDVDDDSFSGRTRLFPTTSGILKSMNRKSNSKYKYIAIDGVDNCKKVLIEAIKGNINGCFIEMSSCIGSCIGGPAMGLKHNTPIENYIKVVDYAGKEHFEFKDLDYSEKYESNMVEEKEISKEIEKELLAKLGKTKPEDELNCGSCGYNTCKEKVKAMYYGKTDVTMCLPYLKSKAESYMDNIVGYSPNAIIILNDKLNIELINKSACELFNIPRQSEVIGAPIVRIIDPYPYLCVLNSKGKEVNKVEYFAEYDKYVEQTILYDDKYHIVMIIMRNITDEVNEKKKKENVSKRTIEVTDKVIERQMRAVQEIASLLGETTAETKVALEKLKESLDEK